MARSAWKLPFVDGHVLKKARGVINSDKVGTVIKTWSRRSTIIPEFVGLTFNVYNGRRFIPVRVTEDMVNKKFGEFAPTRTFKGHSGDKKANKV
jgi:small subunit ribosomal protein S19